MMIEHQPSVPHSIGSWTFVAMVPVDEFAKVKKFFENSETPNTASIDASSFSGFDSDDSDDDDDDDRELEEWYCTIIRDKLEMNTSDLVATSGYIEAGTPVYKLLRYI